MGNVMKADPYCAAESNINAVLSKKKHPITQTTILKYRRIIIFMS